MACCDIHLVQHDNLWELWNFRTKELSFPGTKVPWVELSFLGTFVSWNFRS